MLQVCLILSQQLLSYMCPFFGNKLIAFIDPQQIFRADDILHMLICVMSQLEGVAGAAEFLLQVLEVIESQGQFHLFEVKTKADKNKLHKIAIIDYIAKLIVMLILPSKQSLLLSSSESRDLYLFDPKTTSVIHKYRTENYLAPLCYLPKSEQFIANEINKSFVGVWSIDSMECTSKISLGEEVPIFEAVEGGVLGGGSSGNLYYWEFPSGILIKKKNIHSSPIKSIIPLPHNQLLTTTKNSLKLHKYSSVLLEESNLPQKQYTSILEIIDTCYVRNLIFILTNKNLTILELGGEGREFKVRDKWDYEFACTIACSAGTVFVGDYRGEIQLREISTEEPLLLGSKEGMLEIARSRKRRTYQTPSKVATTSMGFVSTLNFLVVGSSNGQLSVFNTTTNELKKSFHLFKSSLTTIHPIYKPSFQKVAQSLKLKHLHKYELGKDNEPLILNKSETEDHICLHHENDEQQNILLNMLQVIGKPQRRLMGAVEELKEEREKLMEANNHYFRLFCN